jgi:hypothetical protein
MPSSFSELQKQELQPTDICKGPPPPLHSRATIMKPIDQRQRCCQRTTLGAPETSPANKTQQQWNSIFAGSPVLAGLECLGSYVFVEALYIAWLGVSTVLGIRGAKIPRWTLAGLLELAWQACKYIGKSVGL